MPEPRRFSPDGKHVLFAISPSKDAKAKGPGETGRTDLGIMDVQTGTVKRIERSSSDSRCRGAAASTSSPILQRQRSLRPRRG